MKRIPFEDILVGCRFDADVLIPDYIEKGFSWDVSTLFTHSNASKKRLFLNEDEVRFRFFYSINPYVEIHFTFDFHI
jgi:hypothetical protein